MKKQKFLAVLLALAMMACALPMAALAEGEPLDGQTLTETAPVTAPVEEELKIEPVEQTPTGEPETKAIDSEQALRQAINDAASAGNVVDMGNATITLTAQLDIPAGVTLQNGVLSTDTAAVTLAQGSKLINVDINKTTKTTLNIVQITGANAVMENCDITGQYALGDAEVVRGVVPKAGVSGYLIKGCTFTGLRQPGYLEGEGTVENCKTTGTRGWVVTQNHKVTFTGCTFENNADGNSCNINIIPNGGQANAYTAEDLKALSTNNPGAYVIHQENKVALLDNVCLVTSVSGQSGDGLTDLQKFASLDGAQAMGQGTTAKLQNDLALDKMLTINTQNVTLDLGGNTISAAAGFTGDGNAAHLVDVTADGVTVKNGTLTAGAANNHTLNVWNADSVTLENLKLDNSNAVKGGAPLIVGASSVTVQGKLETVTGENSWYAINVDSRNVSGTATSASLTTEDGAQLTFGGQSDKVGIYFENNADAGVSVGFGSNTTVSTPDDDFVVIAQKEGVTPTITNPGNAGLQENADGTFSPIPQQPTQPSQPSDPAPAPAPAAPAPVLDSTPKTGDVSLAALALAGLALAGVGVIARRREH